MWVFKIQYHKPYKDPYQATRLQWKVRPVFFHDTIFTQEKTTPSGSHPWATRFRKHPWGLKVPKVVLFTPGTWKKGFWKMNDFQISRWWQLLKYLFIFSFWGDDPNWLIFFKLGWNHPLGFCWNKNCWNHTFSQHDMSWIYPGIMKH